MANLQRQTDLYRTSMKETMRYDAVRHQIFETRLPSVLQAPLFDCVAFDPSLEAAITGKRPL